MINVVFMVFFSLLFNPPSITSVRTLLPWKINILSNMKSFSSVISSEPDYDKIDVPFHPRWRPVHWRNFESDTDKVSTRARQRFNSHRRTEPKHSKRWRGKTLLLTKPLTKTEPEQISKLFVNRLEGTWGDPHPPLPLFPSFSVS